MYFALVLVEIGFIVLAVRLFVIESFDLVILQGISQSVIIGFLFFIFILSKEFKRWVIYRILKKICVFWLRNLFKNIRNWRISIDKFLLKIRNYFMKFLIWHVSLKTGFNRFFLELRLIDLKFVPWQWVILFLTRKVGVLLNIFLDNFWIGGNRMVTGIL